MLKAKTDKNLMVCKALPKVTCVLINPPIGYTRNWGIKLGHFGEDAGDPPPSLIKPTFKDHPDQPHYYLV